MTEDLADRIRTHSRGGGAPWAFSKYHGLGNDFLVGPARPGFDAVWAAAICSRHSGVGADGVMLLGRVTRRGLAARILNADGSEAEFSGNGVRCVARHVFRETRSRRLTVLTAAGPIECWAGCGGNAVALGFEPAALRRPEDPPVRPFALPRGFPAGVEEAIRVVLGNPHAVLLVSDADRLPAAVKTACERLCAPSRLFPDGVNVSVLSGSTGKRWRLRTWERGVGSSPSCASAACACLYAGRLLGFLPADVLFAQDGGELELSERDSRLTLSGPIVHVFDGRWSGSRA